MDETDPSVGKASSDQAGAPRYAGEVVYIYAFDVAYDMKRQPVPRLLGEPAAQFTVGLSKRGPREMFFYRPQMFDLPPLERTGPHGPVSMRRTVKLFPVGAISIAVHVPFDPQRLEDLADYHDLRTDHGLLQDEARALAEIVRKELLPHCIRPVTQLRDEEAYTVFCLHAPPAAEGLAGAPAPAESWLAAHRRQVAAILTQETDAARLSDQEARESTGLYLSYYEQDLAVIDWDAALLIDRPENLGEVLHVAELANVQLAELEAYDRILDEAVERSYRDLRAPGWGGRREVLAGLAEIRIDLARLSDELSNTTKFFGDWHLARVYQALSARFHLDDWSRVIDEKLNTLGDMYTILKQDQTNRWMMILEAAIVLLFVIDLVVILVGLGK